MRRIAPTLLAAALPLSLLAFAPTTEDAAASDTATATETTDGSATVTPDPVEVVFHLHGGTDTAYIDDDDPLGGGMPMDREAPSSSEFESMQLLNYVGGPNTQCTGNGLFPTWDGYIGNGTVDGTAVLEFDVVGSPGGTAVVDLWADVTAQNCNEAYIAPDASVEFTLPAGAGRATVEIPLDGLDPDFQLRMMLRANTGDPLSQGRVLYDGTDYDATLTLTCQPDAVATQDEAAAADCMPF